MDKKQKQLVFTLILVAVFILALANSIGKIKKRHPRAPAAPPPAAIPQAPRPDAAAAKTLPPSEKTEWGRDPFSGKEYKGAAQKQEEEQALKLSGVLWSKASPAAIINNKVCKTGDQIAGYVIQEIKEDRVVLDNGAHTMELKVGQ
jgi:hypothetical protein